MEDIEKLVESLSCMGVIEGRAATALAALLTENERLRSNCYPKDGVEAIIRERDAYKEEFAESQRRERAAVEDMKSIVKQNVSDFASGTYTTPCRYCKDLETCDYIPADGGCCFKWRGPGAGEGEAK